MTLKSNMSAQTAWPLIALLLCLSAFTSPAGATAQRSDTIQIEGKKYPLLATPLDQYLADHPSAFPLDQHLVGDPSELPKVRVISTGLWRGYIASWSVENERLFVGRVDLLVGMRSDENQFLDIAPGLFGTEGPVLADWYSGYLIVPTGKLSNYVHMGFASLYRKYFVMRVEQGVVVESVKMKRRDFVRFRESQFELYKKTPKYARLLEEVEGDAELAFQLASEEITTTIFGVSSDSP